MMDPRFVNDDDDDYNNKHQFSRRKFANYVRSRVYTFYDLLDARRDKWYARSGGRKENVKRAWKAARKKTKVYVRDNDSALYSSVSKDRVFLLSNTRAR